jgi:exosome complex RNA-binding protein Rrp42 (RNase PH superfamily)
MARLSYLLVEVFAVVDVLREDGGPVSAVAAAVAALLSAM